MINVFDIGNDNYTGNGNAVLMPTECRLTNIAGGNYDLSMTHPIDPDGKWRHLVPGAIIRCPVPYEEIENAYAGYDVDVYKTTVKAELRDSPSEQTAITYQTWDWETPYEVGDRVSVTGWTHRNYECTYYDGGSPQIQVPPYNSSWWREIPDTTDGAPVLVTLAAGTELYFVEDYDTAWYKMATYYGIVGYIRKNVVAYDRHLTPSETLPRIITTQLFRIEKPTVDTKNRTVTVTAKHVSYDLNGVLIQDVHIAQASPAMALGKITEGFMIPYAGTIATNLAAEDNGTYTNDIKGKNGTFALLDPDKGIVSTFDAAFRRDNWDLFVMTKTEIDRGFRIKYRKNMLGVNWTQDSSGIITRIVPVAKDAGGADLYLPEVWIDSDYIGDYPVIRMEQLSVKGQVGKDKGLGDGSTWTEEDLLDEMRTKAEERFSVDKADRISVTVAVDFEQLGDTEEYRALKDLEQVLLYDLVTVENEAIGLSVQLYVSELEWDAIRRKVTALKLVNATEYSKGNVTGYNVQSKSISPEKLTDDVAGGIIDQVKDIIPEYADPEATRPGTVTVTDGDPTLAWGTRSTVGTIGGSDIHVTMPANPSSASDNDPTLAWGTRSKVGTVGGTDLHVTMPANPSSASDNDPTLAWGTRSKVGTVGGTDLHVTMPANPATNGVYYATCSTAAATQTKDVTIAGLSAPYNGLQIRIKFDNGQSYNGQPLLNLNNTGAKGICVYETTAAARYEWRAGEVVDFVYDGTNWIIVDAARATTSYYGITRLVDHLESTSISHALTANMGRELASHDANEVVDVIVDAQTTYTSKANSEFVLDAESIVIATISVNNAWPRGVGFVSSVSSNISSEDLKGSLTSVDNVAKLTAVSILPAGTYYIATRTHANASNALGLKVAVIKI